MCNYNLLRKSAFSIRSYSNYLIGKITYILFNDLINRTMKFLLGRLPQFQLKCRTCTLINAIVKLRNTDHKNRYILDWDLDYNNNIKSIKTFHHLIYIKTNKNKQTH